LKIHKNIQDFKAKKPILTVGTFDGVHLGHKKILSVLTEEAEKNKGESVVFTLYPHPRKVLNPDFKDLFLLNTLDEKIQLLEKAGINNFIIYPFTKDFANLTSCDFIESILCNKLKIKKLIVGYDHRFGKDKQDNLQILQNCAKPFGTEILKVEPFSLNGKKVSSTKIRNALLSGNIIEANECLGYDYFLSGKVVSGNRIGRTIGFPTANINIHEEKLLPASGVYAVKIIIDGKEHNGMLNIGSRPTINAGGKTSTEVHIFDFNRDIYGKVIYVYFKKFIRNEIKFSTKYELKKQIEKDKEETDYFFKKESGKLKLFS